MAKKTKDVNISINSIEVSAVSLVQKRLKEQQKIIQHVGISAISDYIFGKSDDNPLQEITDNYNIRLQELRERVLKVVKVEKTNYLGKKKRGVNFIKKIKIED